MTDTSTPSIPVSLQVDGQTIFSGQVFPQALLSILKLFAAASVTVSKSYPLTHDQARLLLRAIDPKTVEFLKALSANDGELSFGEMKRIFGIDEWVDYSSRFGKGLTRAVRHLTKNSAAILVSWDDDEWESASDPEGLVYVDGQALDSLRAAFDLDAGAV